MPKREDPEFMVPGSLAWERMQARKFIWQDGDVEIMPVPKKAPGKELPRPREGEGHSDPERG